MKEKLDNFDPGQIADSGQCFRMSKVGDELWRCYAGDRILLVRRCRKMDFFAGDFDFSCDRMEFDQFWRSYFDLDFDYGTYIRAVDPEDNYLLSAVRAGGGIRILRQNSWETLATFLLSQRKTIPAIRTCVETLCTRYGNRLPDGSFGFPSPKALASCSESELRECSLGYRAPYMLKSAGIASKEDNLSTLSALSDEELIMQLKMFPGVGIKVANCTALFGFHRLAAFPRDVWVNRIEAEHYNGHFAEERYPGFAGVLQQYMFYFERKIHEKIH